MGGIMKRQVNGDFEKVKSLFDKIVEFDIEGKLINELLERKVVSLEDIVAYAIDSNKFEYMYFIAKNIKDIDLSSLEDKVLEMNSLDCMIMFSNLEGVNVKKFEDKIISLNNFKYFFEFAKNVKNVNMKRFEDLVISSNDLRYILRFAVEVRNCNVNRLADIFIESGNTYYIMLYAMHVKKAPYEKLVDKIIEVGDPEEIIAMADEFNLVYLDKLTDAIINTKNAHYICEFGVKFEKDLSVELVDKLAYAVMEYGTNLDIYYFASTVEKAPEILMLKKIKENNKNQNKVERKNKVKRLLHMETK